MHLWIQQTVAHGNHDEDIWINKFHELTAHRHLIGRAPMNGLRPDILLPYNGISRLHAALLSPDGMSWFIEDLGNAHGTHLLKMVEEPPALSWSNFQRIPPNEPVKLRVGDYIVFAGTVVTQLTSLTYSPRINPGDS